jgi:hypothetical protein
MERLLAYTISNIERVAFDPRGDASTIRFLAFLNRVHVARPRIHFLE